MFYEVREINVVFYLVFIIILWGGNSRVFIFGGEGLKFKEVDYLFIFI